MDFEEVDVSQVQKLDGLAISPDWRPVARRLRLRAKFSILPLFLAIGLALGVFCLASGHPLAGLWLIAASLSWAFLRGAGDASEQCSGAPQADGEASIDAPVDHDHAES
jgi:hypothetical protein